MTRLPDPFEAELESMRPCGVSPKLVDRVGQALVGKARRRRVRVRLIGAASMAAAACLLVSAMLLLSRNTDPSGPGAPDRLAVTLPAPSPPGDDDGRPVLASYQRALSRSPESFDALLDRHAARGRGRSTRETTLTLSSGFEVNRQGLP